MPKRCGRCQQPLPAQPGPDDPEPTWHQLAELPPMAAPITEYQGHYRTCPCCGEVNHAAIPQDLQAHSVGPRLAAALSYLAGSHRLSKRGLEEILEDRFDIPVALGTVAPREAQRSAAVAPAHAEALPVVRDAAVKNVEETSGKLAGKLCWLGGAATGAVATFRIHAPRGGEALVALLGEKVQGFIGSDHWSAYARLLKAGRRCADRKAATCCANLVGLVPALGRFVVTEGVEPTNNHAERLLRRRVRWRQSAFGCHSATGCRFVERILTVVQTRRLQGRSVLRYL